MKWKIIGVLGLEKFIIDLIKEVVNYPNKALVDIDELMNQVKQEIDNRWVTWLK